jgi:cytochrome c5
MLLILLIIFVSACTATRLVTPTQTDAERGAQQFPGYTLTELEQGKAIYQSHCNKCHRYKAPESRDEEKWNHIIPVMAKKAKLDSNQESLVLKYVVTMSTAKSK